MGIYAFRVKTGVMHASGVPKCWRALTKVYVTGIDAAKICKPKLLARAMFSQRSDMFKITVFRQQLLS